MRTVFNRRHDTASEASIAAARWALLQDRGEMTPSLEREFAAWIADDEAHLLAYEDALWALDAVAGHAGATELLELRKAALSPRGHRRRFWNLAGAGALAASIAALFIWYASPNEPGGAIRPGTTIVAENPNSAAYRTRIGERSAITLPDGSVVTLDTDSRIRVAFDDKERAVHLLQGQAMFEVAHGKALPFTVYAQRQRITALGTIFNVRIEGDEVRVAMVEGSVRVRRDAVPRPANNHGAPIPRMLTLTAGEALVAEPERAMTVTSVDTRQVSSWTGGMLMFNDTRLADAVAEINRYTTKPIAISDARIGSYRISGVFKSNDPDHFARAMAEFLPVTTSKTPEGATVLRMKAD